MIKINTGVIRLEVECDGIVSHISFNPRDIIFMDNFYKFYKTLDTKMGEVKMKLQEAGIDEKSDDFDPKSLTGEQLEKQIEIGKEVCSYLRSEFDTIFGDGASLRVFGPYDTVDLLGHIGYFLQELTPYIEKARGQKLGQYVGKKTKKGKNVMS